MALLELVAISYSLSAERNLWAGMRSDRVAKRAATSNVAMNVRDKYQRAKFELDGLLAARPRRTPGQTQYAWGASDFAEGGDKGYRLIHLTPPVEIPRDW